MLLGIDPARRGLPPSDDQDEGEAHEGKRRCLIAPALSATRGMRCGFLGTNLRGSHLLVAGC
jgi:hypothetical protein